jgi:DNA-directed RNA polymerase subunit beta'
LRTFDDSESKKYEFLNDFDWIRISLASPDKIREWSHGEVTKPETINYRTFKPERDGLFCAKIFGPVKDWECLCGKYKRIKHRGIVCDKCGVEVIKSKVRRERLGHIELASPVSHVWFFKGTPSKIGHILGMTLNELERVLYFENYIVLDTGDTPLKKKELLTEDKFKKLSEKYEGKFRVGMGAEAIRELLDEINIDELSRELKSQLNSQVKIDDPGDTDLHLGQLVDEFEYNEKNKKAYTSGLIPSKGKRVKQTLQNTKKLLKRLKVVESFKKSVQKPFPGNKPSWMILDVIPVIPPELRPLVPLDGGRFATSDLNDLYRRVINRNNRLKKLIELKAPEVILRNEKRMLQEAVDALFDNGRRGRTLRGPNNRPFKSISDMLRGKQGRFRQNLLGKRVDYSGRSVIVVGPELKLDQCGLPKKMALELFKPFIFHKLEEKGLAYTVKSAKKMVEKELPVVWDALEEIVKEHPVMLNRAPTLHRLGIQAFQPILVEGKAIRIHPLVCEAFNADFDGDQMAVHVPLSLDAQIEARTLMMASNNILSPAYGKPITVPTQDIVLGCYYLSKIKHMQQGEGKSFGSTNDCLMAYDRGVVHLQALIKIDLPRWKCGECGKIMISKYLIHKCPVCWNTQKFEKVYLYECTKCKEEILDEIRPAKCTNKKCDAKSEHMRKKLVETTPGRIIFNENLPIGFEFVNTELNKSTLRYVINTACLHFERIQVVEMLDKLKDLGFKHATKAGISICIDDILVPSEKQGLIDKAEKEVEDIQHNYEVGKITNGERYNKVIDIWANTTEEISSLMFDNLRRRDQNVGKVDLDDSLAEFNPIFMMADSGARGGQQQIRQLAGMRGLMTKPSGEIIETPIVSNFREGLSVLQYFVSTHGARKGLADTALKTADSGYLTRRLVDVAQDVTITEDDCGTLDGIELTPLIEGMEVVEPLKDRVLGKVALDDVKIGNDIIVNANQEIDERLAQKIENFGIQRVKIRSVLTCESKRGVCIKCYGRNLASGRMVEIGEAVGVIAAQSIGEPGTQLTMRTFHIGGTASTFIQQDIIRSKYEGVLKYDDELETVVDRNGLFVVISRKGSSVQIIGNDGLLKDVITVMYGSRIKLPNGSAVKTDDEIIEWDPYAIPILTEQKGIIRYVDVRESITMKEEIDEVSGLTQNVIIDHREESVRPSVEIINRKTKNVVATYNLPTDARLILTDKTEVLPGDIIAKLPRETMKTKDITGGLPRVVELFEARKPQDHAVISEIDGFIYSDEISKNMRKIVVQSHLHKIDEPGDTNFKKDQFITMKELLSENERVKKEGGREALYLPEYREYIIPKGTHFSLHINDAVKAGEPLMDGPPNPHDILNVLGEKELQKYLVNEVQEVYKLQGVDINDTHVGVIVRQMLRRVIITDPGDTDFLNDEQVDKFQFMEKNKELSLMIKITSVGDSNFYYRQLVMKDEFDRINKEIIDAGGIAPEGGPPIPAKARSLLLGITKASLSTDSFLSAASFQETTRVLTEASISGKLDKMRGLKENVVVGRLIPAGTGFYLRNWNL